MRPAEISACLILVLAAAPAGAADAQQGRMLYETYCGTCHYEKLHERKATNIKSFAALKVEIEKWSRQASRRFTPAELDDIAEYLDQSHYRLAK